MKTMDEEPGPSTLLLSNHIESQDYDVNPPYGLQTDPVYLSVEPNHEHTFLDSHNIDACSSEVTYDSPHNGENHMSLLMNKSDEDVDGVGSSSIDHAGIETEHSLSIDPVGIVPTHDMSLGSVRIGIGENGKILEDSGIETAHSNSLDITRTKMPNSIIINATGNETTNHITLSATRIVPSNSISINVAPKQISSSVSLNTTGSETATNLGLNRSTIGTTSGTQLLINQVPYEEDQYETRPTTLQPTPTSSICENPAEEMSLLIDKTSGGDASNVAMDISAGTTVHRETETSHNTTVTSNRNTNVTERLEEAQLIINLQRPRRQSEVDVTVATEEPPSVTGTVGNGDNTGAPQQGSEVITIERREYHECYICKMRFKSITALFKHRVAHNEQVENTFSCDVCNQVFSDHLQLAIHRYLHIEVRVYRCGICLDTFETEDKYNFHLRIHDREGPYVCNICSQVFDKKLAFLDHHYQHKPRAIPPKNTLQCDSLVFDKKLAFLDHHYQHKPRAIPPKNNLQCDTCQRVFADAPKLKRHMLTHSTDKFFRCSVCQKSFVERSKLTRHMLTHSGKRDHVCTVCGKSFTLKYNLHQHMNIHKGVKPYKCGVCGKDFVQRIVMQRHMKVHEMVVIHTPGVPISQ